MRLTTFLLICFLGNISAETFSQKFTFDVKGETIKDLLAKIEENSDYKFLYRSDVIDINKEITLNINDENLESIMEKIFDPNKISYKIFDNSLVVIASGSLLQQQITGLVTDASNGELMPGVNIQVKGTNIGAISGVDGQYTISGTIDKNAVLVFSFVGYIVQEVPLAGKVIINVALVSEVTKLEEVVVIAYGTTTRQNFTGSVSTVNMSTSPITNTSTTNAFSLLNGVTTGINFTRSGEAGQTGSLLIRGQRSIGGSSDPLIVVNGTIFAGSLNDIDPSTVANIQVLKDATSLAAYGSMAANGVIMVTTKKGLKGKPVININMTTGISNPNFRPDMRDAQGYIDYMNAKSGSTDLTWMSALERDNYNENTSTDWYDLITRTGVEQNYAASVSGAGDNMDYFLSASNLDNKNFIVGDQYNRTTFSARINTMINKYLSIGGSLNQSYSKNDGVRPNYGAAVTLSPWTEPYLSDGRWRRYVDGREQTTQNALWDTYNGVEAENHRNATVIGGYAEIKLPWIKGLSYKVSGSYEKNNTTVRRFVHETNFVNMALGEGGYTTVEQDKFLDQANGTYNENKRVNWVIDNVLNYTKQLNKHYINASLVYTRDSRQVDVSEMTATDFKSLGNTNLGFYGLNYATTQKVQSMTYSLHNDVGYLARANYSYNNTYHLNASVRRDGSSVFGSENRWGIFPAVGIAWTVSQEPFMSSIKPIIDNLKVKASWGKNGTQTLSPYGTLSTMNVGKSGGVGYIYNNIIYYGQSINTLGNNELAWVTTTSWNFGVEGDILGSRIHFEIDGYKSKTTDQIFNRIIPVMGAGITNQQATMGQIDNWGIEAVLNTKNIDKGDFRWTSVITFTINRNKIVDLYGDGKDDIPNNYFIGKSLGAIYGYKWIGVIQANDVDYITANGGVPGDAMFANFDGSADGKITPDDRTILGYSRDNFRMSLQNTLSYKNLQLYFLFNGIFGGNTYGMAPNNSAYITSDSYAYHNTLDHPYWTEENQSTKYPRIFYSDNRFTALQSYGFVRLQEANISYSFNKNLLNKFGFTNIKVFVSGSNLFFIAPNWEYSDPEIRSFSAAQLPRIYTLGINLTF